MEHTLWYFYLYAFLGWCVEVVFAALKNGRFVNRGFLNGPVCPIYGFGLVAVLFLVRPVADQLTTLYLGSVLLTTVMELATGFLMEKLFHQRWWDYSKIPLNIGGYVCPLFSLLWGVACVLIVKVLHPHVAAWVALIPQKWSITLLSVFTGVFVTDVSVTLATVARLNRRLTQLDDLSEALRLTSDRLGETMAGGALVLKAHDEKACEELLDVRQRTQRAVAEADDHARAELRSRYAALVEKLDVGQRRILQAFPALRSLRHPDSLHMVQKELSRKWESRHQSH